MYSYIILISSLSVIAVDMIDVTLKKDIRYLNIKAEKLSDCWYRDMLRLKDDVVICDTAVDINSGMK
jgi:hypothetical protein